MTTRRNWSCEVGYVVDVVGKRDCRVEAANRNRSYASNFIETVLRHLEREGKQNSKGKFEGAVLRE